MLNYEPPVEFSIFDFQNLNFRFYLENDSYFLRIYNLNPVSSFYLLERANMDYLQALLDVRMLAGVESSEGLKPQWLANGDAWGFMIHPAKLDVDDWNFLIELRLRLSTRNQDMRGVLDVDTYMRYIREEAIRFWDELDYDYRITILNDLVLTPEDRNFFASMDAWSILMSAYTGTCFDGEELLQRRVIVAHITKIILEANKYVGFRV
jgi:hypothetical protein